MLLAIDVGWLIVFVPLAVLVGRDAKRHARNGWVWGVLFVWQPVIAGLAYWLVRRRTQRAG